MKKVPKSTVVSTGLGDYVAANPGNSWDQFRDNAPDALYAVKEQLVRDQRGLCAYCEIDTQVSVGGVGLDDFRVEHFHPKSPVDPTHNYGLDWFNLLGVCHGGSQRDVAITSRHTSPDHSCDVPKNNQNLVGVIFNPTQDVPAFPRFFQYIENGMDAGKVEVDKAKCPTSLHMKGEQTIEKLRLNASRLTRLRKGVIDKLREEILNAEAAGEAFDIALSNLSQDILSPSADGHWPAFFTCIRWYLGAAAENHLEVIDYQG